MSGVRKTTRIAARTGEAQEQADHRLAVATSPVRSLSTAAHSCSLEPGTRSSRPPFRFLTSQTIQISRSGLTQHRQDGKA
jgi:hypothetical protein